jgi:hypothetical protein
MRGDITLLNLQNMHNLTNSASSCQSHRFFSSMIADKEVPQGMENFASADDHASLQETRIV